MEARLFSDNCVILDSKFPVDELPLIIGRSPEVAIRVGDRLASRRHCEIAEKDGLLVVRDLGSSHGTLLNGQPVTESTLTPGDKLTVGLTTLLVSSNLRHLQLNAGHDGEPGASGSMPGLRAAAARARQIVEAISRRIPQPLWARI